MDIHVITCRQTWNRLPSLFESIYPLMQLARVGEIRIIYKCDQGYFDVAMFDDCLWLEHLSSIIHILAVNTRDVYAASGKKSAHSSTVGILQCLDDCERLFARRRLKDSEMSLLHKHYTSLSAISSPTLVLEDDARLCSVDPNDLLVLADYCRTHDAYFDLCFFGGLQGRGRIMDCGSIQCHFSPVAMTRTTTASLISPAIAKILRENFWPCSLPADLHYQYLFSKYSIPGFWPLRTYFLGASTVGGLQSSIQ